MAREKKFSEDKIQELLVEQHEETLEQRHAELANGLALVVDAVQSIQPQSIDLSPVIGELKSVAKTIEATQNDDVNIILSHLDKHFATIGKKLDSIEVALRPRYESIDTVRNNQGLITKFNLIPIKGN
jgi:hypothetical protein